MATNSDPRYRPDRFRGAPELRRTSRARPNDHLAQRKKIFEEHADKAQWVHRPRILREPHARD